MARTRPPVTSTASTRVGKFFAAQCGTQRGLLCGASLLLTCAVVACQANGDLYGLRQPAEVESRAKISGKFEGTESGLHFAPARGLYRGPIDVVISHSTAQRLVYTLDGSDPATTAEPLFLALPAKLHIDPSDVEHRYAAPGVVVRATVLQEGSAPGQTVTHTYLFTEHVAALSVEGRAPGDGWPAQTDRKRTPRRFPRWAVSFEVTLREFKAEILTGIDGLFSEDAPAVAEAAGVVHLENEPQVMDYGVDANVISSAGLGHALRSVPTISLVTELPNLFDSKNGIYVNARQRGREWERPVSVELLDPEGAGGFQANAGLRIRGNHSRNGKNPKHSFRLYFRKKYGTRKLRFPLFGDEGAQAFDRIDLRTTQNHSWQAGSSRNTLNRDVFSRDLQRELGRPYTRSRYYHLYLNGVYWGVYQSQEHVDDKFAKSYFGGRSKDFDVMKARRAEKVGVVDGDSAMWERVWALCKKGFVADENFFELQGMNAQGERVDELPVLVDVGNLIDFMLVTFYTGNVDGPVTKFEANKRPNNFYAIRSRVNSQGYVFLAHDAEHTLLVEPKGDSEGLYEDRVNIGSPSEAENRMQVTDIDGFHPQWLHHRLVENAEYRTAFSARAAELLSGEGLLTEKRARALFLGRAREIQSAVCAESARWGNFTYKGRTLTKQDDWIPAIHNITEGFFPFRSEIVIEQLRQANLY